MRENRKRETHHTENGTTMEKSAKNFILQAHWKSDNCNGHSDG